MLPDWCAAHVRALEYLGAAPEFFVPDNSKSAVTWACRYEPLLNRTDEALGPALRRGDPPGAGSKSARQDQGRAERLTGRTLGARPASSPNVLLA